MYVFGAGSGCSGVPTMVKPGDELIFNTPVVCNEDLVKIEESVQEGAGVEKHVVTETQDSFYSTSTPISR